MGKCAVRRTPLRLRLRTRIGKHAMNKFCINGQWRNKVFLVAIRTATLLQTIFFASFTDYWNAILCCSCLGRELVSYKSRLEAEQNANKERLKVLFTVSIIVQSGFLDPIPDPGQAKMKTHRKIWKKLTKFSCKIFGQQWPCYASWFGSGFN